MFRGRQCRACRPRSSEASGGRSLGGGGAYRLLISVWLRLRKRLCQRQTGLRRFERLAAVRRWDCRAGAQPRAALPALAPGWLQLLPDATVQDSSLAAREGPWRYWRPARPAPASPPPGAHTCSGSSARGRVARDHTCLSINLISFSNRCAALDLSVFFILRLWTASAGPSAAAGPREEHTRSQTLP